jgi:hypothetical protein
MTQPSASSHARFSMSWWEQVLEGTFYLVLSLERCSRANRVKANCNHARKTGKPSSAGASGVEVPSPDDYRTLITSRKWIFKLA